MTALPTIFKRNIIANPCNQIFVCLYHMMLVVSFLYFQIFISLFYSFRKILSISFLLLKTLSTDKYSCLIQHVSLKFCLFLGQEDSVQGDPDLETFQSLYFHFRESTLSDLAPSLAICLYVYITICTPPPISPLYHTVLKTGGKVNIKTNDYSPLKKG